MSIKTIYQKIPLAKIDMADRFFSLAPVEEDQLPDQLRASIESYGIIHPPLLLQTDNLYIVVTGRRRLIAATDVLKQDFCNCLVLPPETTPAMALALALEDIQTSRPPSPVEQAKCWQKVVELLGEEEAREEFGSRLEIIGKLPPSGPAKLMELGSEILTALHAGGIKLKIASRLMAIDQEGRRELFSIISRLRLSHSNQRKLIDQCRELSKRHKRTVIEILADPECREIIKEPLANPPQNTAMLMNWLTGQCHPRLSEAENDHRSFISRLELPPNVSIAHAQSFEKDTLKMTIEFKNRQDLEETWPALKELLREKT
jgi:hypothetical protein